MTNLMQLGLRAAARAVSRRQVSPVELVEAALTQVGATNPRLNALLSLSVDSALASARRVERAVMARRTVGPLAGIPLSIKDLILTRDAVTTLGSQIVPGGLPAAVDAPVVARLRRAGAAIIGKANLHEVALGVTTVNEHFGPARNPWNPARIAGGSSGGSAVAVAVGMGLGSVGTDTRGSIRIPAACCGVVGFKPTYGAVPSDGVFPLAASLDHVGPIARSVEDAALMFGVMAGGRVRLAEVLRAVDRAPSKPRIGVSEFLLRDLDGEVARAIEASLRELEKLGARLVAVDIPELEPALEASRVIVLAEAISYHDAMIRKNPKGYGPNLLARLKGGYRISGLQLVQAEAVRLELISAYHSAFQEVDAMIGAVLPVEAPRLSNATLKLGRSRVPLAEGFCRYNAPQNLTGVPALALPCGMTRAGLPIGLQLIGGWGRDATVLGIGAAYQRVTDWHTAWPALAGVQAR
ncbi:MAG: amidase [Gemmatimonadales bacterium]|nr:amidase [Gemmatimonadales bacterium]